jgi:geranylgeranyl transferase type-2 subunit beta
MTMRLAGGVGEVPKAVRDRGADFVRKSQRTDGGFAGREGGSDVYYTSFAIRTLALLGELEGPVAQKVARFLSSQLESELPLTDRLSLAFAASSLEAASGIDALAERRDAWVEQFAEELKSFRRDDGGYARTPDGHASSTYHALLIAACLQLLGQPVPRPERLAAFALSQQRDDGGFVEVRAMRTSGTNPTAAAIALLRISEEASGAAYFDQADRDAAAQFLAARQTAEGGLAANTRIPFADLLSTFTGLVALSDLAGGNAIGPIDADSARHFVTSLADAGGGFRAADWDDQTDVEYTFYGLGALALLANASTPAASEQTGC